MTNPYYTKAYNPPFGSQVKSPALKTEFTSLQAAFDAIYAADARLAAANVFTKGQAVTPVALSDAATIATDASLSNSFYVTLGGNRTLANPTNLQSGQVLNWKIKQDGTGSRTLAYGSKFKWVGGSAPSLSTAANARDIITAEYWGDEDILVCNIMKGMA